MRPRSTTLARAQLFAVALSVAHADDQQSYSPPPTNRPRVAKSIVELNEELITETNALARQIERELRFAPDSTYKRLMLDFSKDSNQFVEKLKISNRQIAEAENRLRQIVREWEVQRAEMNKSNEQTCRKVDEMWKEIMRNQKSKK